MKLPWLAAKRWWLGRRSFDAPFRQFLGTSFPEGRTSFSQCEFVCLDIETTGLDARKAHILSAGWVLIRGGRVALSTCESQLIRPEGEVGESAAVHGLTDTVVESGQAESVVFSRIVEALTGRILVVHHAGLDKALLDRLCMNQFGCPLPVPVVDTMALELQRRQRRHHIEEKQSLRLADLREAYGLPYYQAHDCLVDAIATAELLIAMVAAHDGPDATRLSRLVG